MSTLPQDVMKQIELARLLRTLKRQSDRQKTEAERAKVLEETALPEGRGNSAAGTYTAAHPLEFLAAGVRRYKGEKNRKAAEEAQAKYEGEFDQGVSDFDIARKMEEARINAEEAAKARAGSVGNAPVGSAPAGSAPTNGPFGPRIPETTSGIPGPNPDPSRLEHPRSPVPAYTPFVRPGWGVPPTDTPTERVPGVATARGPFANEMPPGQARSSGWGRVLQAFIKNKLGAFGNGDF